MVTAALFLALAPLLVLIVFFSIEVALGLLPLSSRGDRTQTCPSAVIIVPAHDEATIIGETHRGLRAALSREMRIVVVADNCSDATAEHAIAAGADVLERCDPCRRGKGFALAFGVEQLAADPPHVVVVIDADCAIDKQSLRALVDQAAESGHPCQAINLLRPDRAAAPLVQISAFAFMFKNLVRQRGLQRVAGRVHLTGTGMAIPFWLVSTSLLASDNIVEDLSLGLEMSARGWPPQLCSRALVSSSSAAKDDALVQRRRWEGGFIATSLRLAPPLFIGALLRRDLCAALAALDLMIPPLALFTFINLAALAAMSTIVFVLDAGLLPLAVFAAVSGLAAVLVLAAWLTEGRQFVSLKVLARIPLYLVWKVPLYLSLARRGAPREWLRTRR